MTKYKELFIYLLFLFIIACSSPKQEALPSPPQNKEFVLNGYKAEHSQFPSIVALVDKQASTVWCTGSLIKPDLILTAAHCIPYSYPKFYSIAYGFSDPTEADPEDLNSVRDRKVHPDYDPWVGEDAWHDVGLILLAEEIEGPEIVNILSPEDYDELLVVGESIFTIAGYGQHIQGEMGVELYAADDVPLIERYEFEMLIGEDNPEAPNLCFGDSGGPTYIYSDDVPYLTGITSRAPPGTTGCGHGAMVTLPGQYLEWIEEAYENMKVEPEEDPTTAASSSYISASHSVSVGSGGGPFPTPNTEELVPSGGCGCSVSQPFNYVYFVFFVLLLSLILSRRIKS